MVSRSLTKDEFLKLISSLNLDKRFDFEFFYAVYLRVYDAIKDVILNNENIRFTPVNPITVIFYIINEYSFSTKHIKIEDLAKVNSDEFFFHQLASTCADKYLTNEQLNYKSESFLNKFNPQVSTLELYLNFTLRSLENFQINHKYTKLVSDMLTKAFQLSKCILNLLIDGNETEAFSTWRTLHENECILTCLIKYGENIFNSYFKHITYALAYRNQIKDKNETDLIFQEMKKEMKEHDLKSKDMKKFIEYGYLYAIPDIKLNEDFKLNFRDGVQKFAGLESYSKVYEMSSEISHSSPLLLFSNKEYYFVITLLNLYETFFRLESIFSKYYAMCAPKMNLKQYELLKDTYINQLKFIYKDMQMRLLRLKRKDSN